MELSWALPIPLSSTRRSTSPRICAPTCSCRGRYGVFLPATGPHSQLMTALIYHACNGVAARARRPDCGCQAQQALQTCGWGVEPRRRRPRVCVTWHGCGRPRRWTGRRSGGSDSFVAGMAAWRGSTTCQAHDDGLRGKLQGRDASSSHRAPAAAARRIRLCHKLGWCVGRPHCGLA